MVGQENVALKSTDDISVQNVSGVGATFTSNVNIQGVLTYEDVTNVDSIGIITARTDINLGDSIIHIGDTNTKIRFPAADTITAETGGNERLRVDSAGRLMLGTTTEGQTQADDLTIATTGHTGITIRSGTSNNGSIFFSDGTSSTDEYRGWVQYTHTTDYLTFGTAATERLRIDSSGRIGVGVVPTAQFDHNLIQIGNQATLGANAALSVTGQTFLTHNLYFDPSGNYQVFNTSNANEGAIFRLVDGQFLFSNSAATTGTPTVIERLRINSSGNVKLPDNGKLQFGGSLGSGDGDLQIYHDGSESVIGNGTGTLQILSPVQMRLRASNFVFAAYDNSETMAVFTDDAAVQLYYNNDLRLETVNGGAKVTGDFNLTGEFNMTADGNKNRFIDCSLDDNEALFIRSTQGGDANHQYMANFIRAGAVELYHAGNKKFETRSNGAEVNGHLHLADNNQLRLGNVGSGGDMKLYHDGVGSIIQNDTGPTIIKGSGSNVDIRHSNDEIMIRCNGGGSVDIRHAGTKVFETSSTGFTLVGDKALSLDPWQGRLDRAWSDYPSISISPSTTYGNSK